MKTENLAKACDSFDFFLDELRKAHSDAVTSRDGIEESLRMLLHQANQIKPLVFLVKNAAGIK